MVSARPCFDFMLHKIFSISWQQNAAITRRHALRRSNRFTSTRHKDTKRENIRCAIRSCNQFAKFAPKRYLMSRLALHGHIHDSVSRDELLEVFLLWKKFVSAISICFRQKIVWQTVFFRGDISLVCSIIVLKLAVTVFTSLYFRTLWPNWLNFFR